MLLASRVQISRVDGGQWCNAQPCLAVGFGKQLVVPHADRFERLAPHAHHTDRLVAVLRQQVIDGEWDTLIIDEAHHLKCPVLFPLL